MAIPTCSRATRSEYRNLDLNTTDVAMLMIWKRGSAVNDVFSWILKEHDAIEKPTKKDVVDLHGDAELIVVAGR